jgi:hypothetical protein
MQLRTDRLLRFPFEEEELWRRISNVEAFTTWWPWLRAFDGRSLTERQVWMCHVRPLLPYAVRFAITIIGITENRVVSVQITGDISGTAALQIAPDAHGCCVRLVSDLEPRKTSLRALSFVARPVTRFGHNWVLDTGARQFVERSGPSPTP